MTQPPRPRVLVVEDEPDIMLLIRLWLGAGGFEVVEAQTGSEAAAYLESDESFDVVLLDLRLPDIDGWTLLTRIRGNERTRSLPVVIASAHAGSSTARRAAEFGCSYVSKPFNPETILAALRSRLGRPAGRLSSTGG